MGHFGDGFCGSDDPTNSVKALKEVVPTNRVIFEGLYTAACMYSSSVVIQFITLQVCIYKFTH